MWYKPDKTFKQQLFCIYYLKYFNATKAYQKAYGVSYETALVAGPRLLGNVRIKQHFQNNSIAAFQNKQIKLKRVVDYF